MGISSKKTTTNQSTTGTSTTTPNVQGWIQNPIENLVGQIGQLSGQNPSQFVAPASGLQNQAFAQGAQTLGSTSPLFGQAADAVSGVIGSAAPMSSAAQIAPTQTASSASLLDGLENYVNPMLENVVRTSLRGYDQNAGQQRAAYAAQGARNGAFSGSRYGLGEGQLLADLVMNRAGTEAGLRSNAYDKAYQYSNMDAQRRQDASMFNAGQTNAQNSQQAGFQQQTNLANQQASADALTRALSGAGLLSGIGSAQGSQNLANLGLLADLGGVQRGIDQAYATAPLSLLQAQQSLLSGLPLSMFNGETTNKSGTLNQTETSSPSLLQGIGQGAQTAASLAALFSDRRLKRDIKHLGTRPDGLGVYEYAYVWGPERHVGVMADEVLKVKPEAVLTHPSGYLMVDYGRL